MAGKRLELDPAYRRARLSFAAATMDHLLPTVRELVRLCELLELQPDGVERASAALSLLQAVRTQIGAAIVHPATPPAPPEATPGPT